MPINIDYNMDLRFLPEEIGIALNNLNCNYLTEIRLRNGQPVIIEYLGEYKYINKYGVSDKSVGAIFCDNAEQIMLSAIDNCIYPYTEQLKRGYITVSGGVRIGIAGEYVTDRGVICSIKNITSLNVRIPHCAKHCSDDLFKQLYIQKLCSVLVFSPPGFGKTTILRDLVRNLSSLGNINVLVVDERDEISGADGAVGKFDLGCNCDVVRGTSKYFAFENVIRAMKPQIIVTDELYGEDDYLAVKRVVACGIKLVASTHVTDIDILKSMPFDYYIELTGVGKRAIVYDKDFNSVCNCNTLGSVGVGSFRRKEVEGKSF